MKKLEKDFYFRNNVVLIARELLGKIIFTNSGNKITAGVITETEAYAGITDRASHAFNGRFTERTKIMYEEGGTAYVYLCYGMHHLFNIVTNIRGVPDAVLIRAIRPYKGLPDLLKRRGLARAGRDSFIGPGKVSQALGISVLQSGTSLMGEQIWLEDAGSNIRDEDIICGPRIGVDYAGEDALRPYRFRYSAAVSAGT